MKRWCGHGVPFIYISGHVALHSFRFKFPPDWWWRRYCRRGTCAYDNFMCPNGCPEDLLFDAEWSPSDAEATISGESDAARPFSDATQ